MPFRAVLFDIGDTLWHSRAAPPPEEFRRIAAERVAAWLRERGYSVADPAALARAAWDAMETAMRTARATDLVEPDYGDVARGAALEPKAMAEYPSRVGQVRPASMPTVSSITSVAASRTSSTDPSAPWIGSGFG